MRKINDMDYFEVKDFIIRSQLLANKLRAHNPEASDFALRCAVYAEKHMERLVNESYESESHR